MNSGEMKMARSEKNLNGKRKAYLVSRRGGEGKLGSGDGGFGLDKRWNEWFWRQNGTELAAKWHSFSSRGDKSDGHVSEKNAAYRLYDSGSNEDINIDKTTESGV